MMLTTSFVSPGGRDVQIEVEDLVRDVGEDIVADYGTGSPEYNSWLMGAQTMLRIMTERGLVERIDVVKKT